VKKDTAARDFGWTSDLPKSDSAFLDWQVPWLILGRASSENGWRDGDIHFCPAVVKQARKLRR
jgi:hypothetical protein